MKNRLQPQKIHMTNLLIISSILIANSLQSTQNRILQNCPTGCATCDDTKKICKTCDPKHFLNEKTNLCEQCGAYCSMCESKDICDICNPGFYLYSRQCLTECPVGYGRSDAGKCMKCDSSCLRCSTIETCDTCADGFYLESGFRCHACPGNCLKCSSRNKCNECSGGYTLSTSGVCEEKTDPFKEWFPWVLLGLGLLSLLCCLGYLLNQRNRSNYRRLPQGQASYGPSYERSYQAPVYQQSQPPVVYKPIYVPVEVEKPTLTNNVSYAAPPSIPQRNLNYSIPISDTYGRVGNLTVSEII